MIKICIDIARWAFSLFIISLCLNILYANSVRADVYVQSDEANEIKISNEEPDTAYNFKIAEPTPAQVSNKLNKTASASLATLPYHQEVMLAAKQSALDPALIHAVIAVESKHQAHASSSKGAYGLMQLMPDTAKRFSVRNKHDTQQNVSAGAQYLRELLNIFNGNLRLSLAAYNAGPNSVKKYHGQMPPYQETQRYVPKVLRYYQQYSNANTGS